MHILDMKKKISIKENIANFIRNNDIRIEWDGTNYYIIHNEEILAAFETESDVNSFIIGFNFKDSDINNMLKEIDELKSIIDNQKEQNKDNVERYEKIIEDMKKDI